MGIQMRCGTHSQNGDLTIQNGNLIDINWEVDIANHLYPIWGCVEIIAWCAQTWDYDRKTEADDKTGWFGGIPFVDHGSFGVSS